VRRQAGAGDRPSNQFAANWTSGKEIRFRAAVETRRRDYCAARGRVGARIADTGLGVVPRKRWRRAVGGASRMSRGLAGNRERRPRNRLPRSPGRRVALAATRGANAGCRPAPPEGEAGRRSRSQHFDGEQFVARGTAKRPRRAADVSPPVLHSSVLARRRD